jgi:hypothetical protein
MQGVSLQHPNAHKHHSSIWSVSSVLFYYFFSFYLSPFMMVVSTSLKILYSFLYRKCINHIHLINFLLFCPPISYMTFLYLFLMTINKIIAWSFAFCVKIFNSFKPCCSFFFLVRQLFFFLQMRQFV